MATKEQVTKFFEGVRGDQTAGTFELLPDMHTLLHIVEATVEPAKADDWPYIKFQSEVAEGGEFEERRVFGMFFFPRPVDEDVVAGLATEAGGNVTKAIARANESCENQLVRVAGQVDDILGEGTTSNLNGDTHLEVMEDLATLLNDLMFVADIVTERGAKKDKADNNKDAERWPDQNRIKTFYHVDTWEE